MYLVRKARLKDIDRIVHLWEGLREDQDRYRLSSSGERVNLEFRNDATDIFRSYCKSNIHSKNGFVSVATFEDAIVGYILGIVQSYVPVFKVGKMGYVSDLYVLPEHRSKGVASKMNEEFEKWLDGKGVRYSSLMVIHSNDRAHSLYSRWGFGDVFKVMRKDLKAR